MGRLSKTTRLADLLYGHPGRYIQRLRKPYDPSRAAESPICLGELNCGCWIVLDGNSRTGLLLSANPEATIKDYPAEALLLYRRGKWDTETMEWWNPAPRTFAELLASKQKRLTTRRGEEPRTFYGLIERLDDGSYYGVIYAADGTVAAKGSTRRQVEGRLRAMLHRRIKASAQVAPTSISVKLVGENGPPHVCPRNSPLRKRTKKQPRPVALLDGKATACPQGPGLAWRIVAKG